FVVIAAKADFYNNFPEFNGSIVFINSSIGSGLNNDGDRITLRDSAGMVIDELTYGDDESVTSLPDVKEGHTLERCPAGGSEFIDNGEPTPGYGLTECTPTPTPTPTPPISSVIASDPVIVPPPDINPNASLSAGPPIAFKSAQTVENTTPKSSLVERPVDPPGIALRSLLITLSLSLLSLFCWSMYRRRAG
ncbi:MAG: hypothetical protein U9N44_05215, partial [Chloroflexota bacterium]|nr:hypothetical protein [Chloroflexota bacterium]